ncbi:MAG: AAA family ATPase, partial [Bacilli bacterium]|nr:AAA family ATPase [Bacilli bacterium]
MVRLKRKIDDFLINWKNDENHYPLIIKGARQIGKTEAIEYFAKNNYQNIVEINFAVQKEYSDIFENGFEVDQIIKNISLKNPKFRFVPNKTLIFFDELQALPNCATCLKPFK